MRIGRVRLAQIIGIVAVLGVAAIAWFAVLSPRLSTASELQAQAETLQTANLALRNQYNQALDQAEAAPAAAAEAQLLFAKMPESAELPTVFDQITEAAVAAGIDKNAVTTLTTAVPVAVSTQTGGASNAAGETASEAPKGVKLATMDVNVTAEGTRGQVLAFLDNLQGLDRALLVTATTDTAVVKEFGQTGGPDLESMQVVGQMFVLESKLPDLVATVEGLIAEAASQRSQEQPAGS